MNQPLLFKPMDPASDNIAKLVPAPISDGNTVSGFSGIMLFETTGKDGEAIVSIGIVAPDGSVVGALLNDRRFDSFCGELTPLVQRARQRIAAEPDWSGATVQ